MPPDDTSKYDSSLAIHCLIDDGNVRDSDIDWEMKNLRDPEFAANFYSQFIESTINFLIELKKIPEADRIQQINEY